jgi:phosphonopyruvate decarboxylase
MSDGVSEAALERAGAFLAVLRSRGYGFFTGVPCSLLGGLYQRLEHEAGDAYVSAVREDAAVGLACGAWLAGRKSCVMIQNSGLGVAYNALASLNEIYEVPALLVISWRGQGGKDAPEHLRMGTVTPRLLDTLEMPWRVLDPEVRFGSQIDTLEQGIERARRPGALVVPKGVFA